MSENKSAEKVTDAAVDTKGAPAGKAPSKNLEGKPSENKSATNKPVAKPKKDIGSIVFYCKDCHELVDTNKLPGKYVYKCAKCGTKNVAFGTEQSIVGFYRLDADVKDEHMEEKSTTVLEQQRKAEKEANKKKEK